MGIHILDNNVYSVQFLYSGAVRIIFIHILYYANKPNWLRRHSIKPDLLQQIYIRSFLWGSFSDNIHIMACEAISFINMKAFLSEWAILAPNRQENPKPHIFMMFGHLKVPICNRAASNKTQSRQSESGHFGSRIWILFYCIITEYLLKRFLFAKLTLTTDPPTFLR